jgi:flagellar hook assembly protein FlgD
MFTCTQNPGSKNIRAHYRVDVPGNVGISVVSSSGSLVGRLTDKYHKAGTYSSDWNATNKSGVYFFVMKTDAGKIVRKSFIVQ